MSDTMDLGVLRAINLLLRDEKIPKKDILSSLAELTGVTPECIIGRTRRYCTARHAYMYILRERFGLTLGEIGEECFHRDHSTVIYGLEKIGLLFKKHEKTLREEHEKEKSFFWDVTTLVSCENTPEIMRNVYRELRRVVVPYEQLDGRVVSSNGPSNRTHYGFQTFRTDDKKGILIIHYYLGENAEEGTIENEAAKITGIEINLHNACPRIRQSIDDLIIKATK